MAGKYQAYPEYKKSGVEWLGEMPALWVIKRIKHIGKVVGGYAFKSGDFIEQGITVIKISNVGHLSFNWSDSSYISEKLLDEHREYIPLNNSLIFAMTRPIISSGVKVAKLSDTRAYVVNQRVGFLKPSKCFNQDYLMYVTQSDSFLCSFENNVTVTNQPNISSEGIEDIRFMCPGIDEQNIIANFLDHETAKIDTLIEKQQQLIKLLKEKRQAVISHVVTKGLNPGAPMRDSGIESIGLIPNYWVLKSLSLASKKLAVGLAMSVTDCYEDEGVPIIRNKNIREGYFDGSDMLYLNPSFAEAQSSKKVRAGDVLIVRTGSNVGLTCCVPDEYDQCHTFTTLIITPSHKLIDKYFTYCMNSAYGKAEVNRLKFGFGKDNLNVGELRAMHTLLPSVDEQNEIVSFLDQETAKIELMVKKAHFAIGLMQERRTTLISAAVTGKIDVRKWQAPHPIHKEAAA